MQGFFWQRGFYFEGRLCFFNSLVLKDFFLFYGLGPSFFKQFFLRLDASNELLNLNMSNITKPGYSDLSDSSLLRLNLSDVFFINERYILILQLLKTFPVFLQIRAQHRLNIWFFFLTNTRRGISLKINKPLRRRTRARAFLNRSRLNMKSEYYVKNVTSKWF